MFWCPICRYSQLPNTTTKNCCSGCGVIQNLWICLVCGDIGCGRYLDGHASKHYELTKHTYAMNINTDEVWDYSGDNFVHRLIQNKKDGSLIDSLKVNNTSNLYRKMDETTSEIIFRFSRELNMQRKFYICKMNEMKKKADDIILEKNLKLIKSKKSLLDFKVEIDSLKNKKICLQENHQKELNKIHSNVIIGHAANLKKLTEKIAKLESCIADEKEMNQCFHVKLKHYEECVEKSKNDVIEKDKELREVKEMNRDLMFSIDASNKINEIKSNLNDSEKMDLRESKLTVNKQKKRNKPKNR
ncbi:hypothetical protein A3Q56_03428 [Intoshia linei]|uniref:UBP-type domain-containing protein n=1 Tax=Intoshia linei TaxID=1819745 RepID=A0A177B3H5_9BILA|nr:hypothetical protein A3Q56_03428 [Intoshia linei]